MQVESGNQQRVAIESWSREPLQSDNKPEAKGHRGARVEFCQLQFATPQGTVVHIEFVSGDLSKRQVRRDTENVFTDFLLRD